MGTRKKVNVRRVYLTTKGGWRSSRALPIGQGHIDRDLGLHGLSQDLETGCLNEGFLDFWVSKVWYKVHTTNEINHILIQILHF